jgi:hypothetical protein
MVNNIYYEALSYIIVLSFLSFPVSLVQIVSPHDLVLKHTQSCLTVNLKDSSLFSMKDRTIENVQNYSS